MRPILQERPEKISTRAGFGEGLYRAGKHNKNVVALCADLTESMKAKKFKEHYSERFFEIGVAEQNMINVAAGMALTGKIPFCLSFAAFSPSRNWEMIRNAVCYNNANVKIIGGHAGIITGPDGATHQATEDIAIMRALPNMKVIVPCDYEQTIKATLAIAYSYGPAYLRVSRPDTACFTTKDTDFTIGKADVYKDGSDATIIACGHMVHEALKSAKMLAKEKINVRVINCHTIKPLDERTIIKAAKETGCIITAEDHNTIGGLGSAVSETLSEKYPVPVLKIGIQDKFGQSGTPEELMKKYEMTASHIAVKTVQALKMRTIGQIYEVPVITGRISHIPEQYYFHLNTGEKIRNLPQLAEALENMDEKTYRYHANRRKNDFSNWIRDVYHNAMLARIIKGCTKEETAKIIKKTIKEESK